MVQLLIFIYLAISHRFSHELLMLPDFFIIMNYTNLLSQHLLFIICDLEAVRSKRGATVSLNPHEHTKHLSTTFFSLQHVHPLVCLNVSHIIVLQSGIYLSTDLQSTSSDTALYCASVLHSTLSQEGQQLELKLVTRTNALTNQFSQWQSRKLSCRCVQRLPSVLNGPKCSTNALYDLGTS